MAYLLSYSFLLSTKPRLFQRMNVTEEFIVDKTLPVLQLYRDLSIHSVEISVFWINRTWWNNRQWIWVTRLQQLPLLLNTILLCFWKVIDLSVSSRSYCHSVMAVSQEPSQLDSHSVSCQSISQSISLSVSQSIKQSRSQAVSQSASQSVSQSVSQPVSQSVSHSVICQSVSNQLVTSQSVSQSVNKLENNDMSSVSQSLDMLMITTLTIRITLGWKGPSTIQPHSIKPTNNNDTQTKNLSTLGVAAFNVTKRTWNNNTV